jgi:hypothetical protein
MTATVFLGPSLALSEARTILSKARYRPPASQGDLLSAVDQDGADVIGLIDGTFHNTLSVWHSEICYLLSRGVTILGASSMGALRALETERFGMVGVGTVFKWYRDGRITGDDEVALLHATQEDGFQPLSLVLVNIRASLDQAVSRGLLARSHADQVVDIARDLYYPDRHLATILRGCCEQHMPPESVASIERALTLDHVDVKGADAREMLMRMQEIVGGAAQRPPRVHFTFQRSSVFDTLYDLDRCVAAGNNQVSLEKIREYAALHRPEFDEVQRAALNRGIVAVFGALLRLEVTPAELATQHARFMADQGLDSADALRRWLETNAINEDDLSEYLTEEARCVRLQRWILGSRGLDRGCRAALDEARMRGIFPAWVQATGEFESTVAAYRDQPEYSCLRQDELGRLAALHASNTGRSIKGDACVWSEDAGFEDVPHLSEALRNSAIFYDVKARIERVIANPEEATPVQTEGKIRRAPE